MMADEDPSTIAMSHLAITRGRLFRRCAQRRSGAIQRGSQASNLIGQAYAIPAFKGFGDTGEHLWSVGGLRRINQMTIPRPVRNAVAVEERSLGGHQRAGRGESGFRILTG